MNKPDHLTILMSPLEWGLGHTVRLVPFINDALAEGHRVILASDGVSLHFLRYRFPDLEWVRMPFYPVRYSEGRGFFWKLLLQIPGMLMAIRRNHRQTGEIVKQFQVTRIISDNRYGLTHNNIHSVFITSQLWLRAPDGWHFGERLVYRMHLFALRRFSEIWIADEAGVPNVTGMLTHPPQLPAKAKYIGTVSRFKGVTPIRPDYAEPFDVLTLVSGPEPQRTIFEKLLLERFDKSGKHAVIFRGLPPSQPGMEPAIIKEGNQLLIDHAPDEQIAWYILHAPEIICRPGISNLSDLFCLGKTALLVPTPGQTEQEYMAGHLERQGRFSVCRQGELIK